LNLQSYFDSIEGILHHFAHHTSYLDKRGNVSQQQCHVFSTASLPSQTPNLPLHAASYFSCHPSLVNAEKKKEEKGKSGKIKFVKALG
jgi:hypothetical protein